MPRAITAGGFTLSEVYRFQTDGDARALQLNSKLSVLYLARAAAGWAAREGDFLTVTR